jgi:hypothetical protein
MIMPVSEGSCNMTMEGAYCPEHGLTKCEGMYEDDSIPRVDVRGIGNLINDIPAGNKLINPIQPRKHNALSPLTPGDSSSMPPVAHVDLTRDTLSPLTPGDVRPHSPVAHVDLTSSPDNVEEGTDDPINYNAAITGSYYEGKETDIQEGDALLARIKSLALLR